MAAPGLPWEIAHSLLPTLTQQLGRHLPHGASTRWSVRVAQQPLRSTTGLADVIEEGRRRLLADGWHLAVCLTDLPLRSRRRPVVAHASATHGVAVLSLPALGAIRLRGRTAEAIVRLIAALVGDTDGVVATAPDTTAVRQPSAAVAARLKELGARSDRDEHGIRLLSHVATGNIRLLLGMLRTNRPWQLALRLSRALVAALGAGVIAVVTIDIWQIADRLDSVRLGITAAGSLAAAVLAIMIGAGLWERNSRSWAREQVVLFNIVTVATVVIGMLAFYAALFTVVVAIEFLLVPHGLLASAVGHRVGVMDRFHLAALATSIAMVGGALGAGLETDEAVRDAAYTYHSDVDMP